MTWMWRLLRRMEILAAIAAGLMIGVVLENLSLVRHQADQRLLTLEEAYEIQSAIANEVSEKLLLSEGVMAAIAARPNITQSDFSRAVSQLVADIDNVINVAAAPDLTIRYVYPYEANEVAIGLDLMEVPELTGAIRQSIETGETVFDGPRDLVQGGRGFITRTPINLYYSDDGQETFWGVVSLVLDADGLFASAGLDGAGSSFRLSVLDDTGQSLFGTPISPELSPVAVNLSMPGIDWTVEAVPMAGWAAVAPNRSAIWFGVIAVTLLTIAVIEALRWAFAGKDAAENHLREAIESLSDGFALYDADGKLIMCNQKYREQYPAAADIMQPGTSLEDILRRGLVANHYPGAIGREEEWIAERLEAQRNPGQVYEQELADGRWLRLEERRTPSGTLAGLRVDITELKHALQRAEAANAAKTNFLNSISHELRTPLSVVLGYNAFLAKPAVLPTYKALAAAVEQTGDADLAGKLGAFLDDIVRFSGQIDVSGKQLMALLSNLLDISAIENGSLQIEMEALDLRSVLDDVANQTRGAADAKGLRLTVEHGAEQVYADPVRLRQILTNVIANAIKFTDTGEVTIRSYHPDSKDDFTRIEITDTGDGIAEHDIDTIFDRFQQADSSSSRKHNGLGLGLAIVKELVDLHGGTIAVQSADGKGTTLRIDLQAPGLGLKAKTG